MFQVVKCLPINIQHKALSSNPNAAKKNTVRINKFREVAVYDTNMQKSVAILYTNSKLPKRKPRKLSWKERSMGLVSCGAMCWSWAEFLSAWPQGK
jgi:hypothetical protein